MSPSVQSTTLDASVSLYLSCVHAETGEQNFAKVCINQGQSWACRHTLGLALWHYKPVESGATSDPPGEWQLDHLAPGLVRPPVHVESGATSVPPGWCPGTTLLATLKADLWLGDWLGGLSMLRVAESWACRYTLGLTLWQCKPVESGATSVPPREWQQDHLAPGLAWWPVHVESGATSVPPGWCPGTTLLATLKADLWLRDWLGGLSMLRVAESWACRHTLGLALWQCKPVESGATSVPLREWQQDHLAQGLAQWLVHVESGATSVPPGWCPGTTL
jgi:hypothetical protein